ncbi:MAG: hypothetical protein NTW28_05565 [Candidatus Solibacter sp.]|nr:hypothetical protein [Candidatus Solibacter sp.]
MTGEEMGKLFEGKTLEGRYHLKRMLASGGFGAVFHAEHRIFGGVVRQVAVKITLKEVRRSHCVGPGLRPPGG